MAAIIDMQNALGLGTNYLKYFLNATGRRTDSELLDTLNICLFGLCACNHGIYWKLRETIKKLHLALLLKASTFVKLQTHDCYFLSHSLHAMVLSADCVDSSTLAVDSGPTNILEDGWYRRATASRHWSNPFKSYTQGVWMMALYSPLYAMPPDNTTVIGVSMHSSSRERWN